MVTYGADNSSILNLNAVCFPHICIMVKSVMSAVLRGKVLGVFLWKTKNPHLYHGEECYVSCSQG